MKLLAAYSLFVFVGEVAAYFIGLTVEHWSRAASVPVFLTCFFVVLWLAWRAALRVA